MEYDVFISYSRKDTQIVDQFVRVLTEAGYRVWIDRDGIYSGDQFATNIVEAIENSKILLFFSSANSNESEWTVREIYYALSEHKTIIPIKIDNAKYDKRIALNLILVDFIQYQHNNFSSAAERLIVSVAKHLSKSEVPAELSTSIESNCPSPRELEFVSLSEKPSNKHESQSATRSSSLSERGMTPEELVSLGMRKYNNQEYEFALECFREAAEHGNAIAQNALGDCFFYGRGVEEDEEEAIKWYRKAAEQGLAQAQYNMGYCYENDFGVHQNYDNAVMWYQKAAEQGNEDAINALEQLNA